ncbi:hypothetical protein Cni_G21389 [Canna indica]|uniref:GLTSCR protein conserved domain-containing protein n=1 Tax=Canna indica TaxID=4628 RepID=A0AAQ3KS01_9LILI|nr:hypothetical protein Cni_G21389 [Canna indica]
MAETSNNDDNNPTSVAQHHQQLLLQQRQQQQLFLMQQQQQLQLHQQQLQHQQQQQQQQQQSVPQASPYNLLQQQAISRFPSNIDAHLRAPGLRSTNFQAHPPPVPFSSSQAPPAASNLHQHNPPQQSQQARTTAAGIGVGRPGNSVEVEMAQKDALMICNPDFKRPFASLEDALLRLLPYHVVSDYEAEEDDRLLDNDTTGNTVSRLQQWDNSILSKVTEFTTTFEKQVLAFNIMSRKRGMGEFRSEERLMIEQALLQEEKQALLKMRAEIESREKAGREAAEAKMRMAIAQTEHARAEARVHAEMYSRGSMRTSAEEISGNVAGQEQGGNINETQGWRNAQRNDEEPSDDFLNDKNKPDSGMTTRTQGGWQEVGELDLNSR